MQNLLPKIVKYSIYVLVFLLPLFFLPFSFEAFEYNKQYLLFFAVSLAFFAWILKQIAYDKEIRFRKSPIDYLVLGFLFLSILSVFFSVDKNSGIFGFYGRFSNGLIGLLSFGAFYFLITNNIRESTSSKEKRSPEIKVSKLLNLFLYSTGAAVLMAYFSVFGIWQKLGSFLPRIMLQRTFNPISGSLEGLSMYLAVIVVLLSGLLLQKIRSVFNWLLLSASLGLMIVVDFTPAWITMLASLVLFVGMSLVKRIFKEDANRLLLPVFLIITALAFMIWQPLKMNLPKEQILPQSISWQVAIKSATDNVKSGFLGSGLGTFNYDFSKYRPQSFNQNWLWQIRFDRAGSHFAELLGTIGFLGVIVYLGLAALFLFICWFLILKDFSGLPLIMAFTALVVSQLVYYQNASLAFVFWMILGLSVVSWRTKSQFSTEKKISFGNFPELSLLFLTLIIILGATILASYFYGVKHYLADTNYSKALLSSGESRTKNLEKAVNLNPGSPNYRTILARAYLTQALESVPGQDSAGVQLFVSRAIDQAREASRLQPNSVANWETLGIIYREIKGIAQGAADWGIKSFERAIDLEPTNPVLYTELGKFYLASGDEQKAGENFNKALENKSDYAAAVIQLALLLEQENNADEAILKLENLIQNSPLEAEARFQLGRIYFNNKRTDEAIEQLNAVIILLPDHSNAHYSLGVAYAYKNEIQLAVQEFEKVLELNPGNTDVIQKLKNLRGY